MYLVMLESSVKKENYIKISEKLCTKLNKKLNLMEDKFLPYNELKLYLKEMNESDLLISYDDRLLEFNVFKSNLDNIFIFRNEELYSIRELTVRNLRIGHNIRKLFLSGEFN